MLICANLFSPYKKLLLPHQFLSGCKRTRSVLELPKAILCSFMPLSYERNSPLDVPAYAFGQGIMRLCRLILRFVHSASKANQPLGQMLHFDTDPFFYLLRKKVYLLEWSVSETTVPIGTFLKREKVQIISE